jgi:hypothetical protein
MAAEITRSNLCCLALSIGSVEKEKEKRKKKNPKKRNINPFLGSAAKLLRDLAWG